MKSIKILPFLVLLILFLNLPMLAQSDSWKNAFTDVEVNFSDKDVTIGLAGGYKFEPLLGIGLKFEKSIVFDNQNILSLNFRGTNFKPGDRWALYYSASLGRGFGDFKFGHYDLALGVRYERLGFALGLYDNYPNFKISQLLGDFKGQGTLAGKIFSPTPKNRYDKNIDDASTDDSQKKKRRYFHWFIAINSIEDNLNRPAPFDRYNDYVGISIFNLGAGFQMNNYFGYGLALRGSITSPTTSPALRYSAIGANFNGYPGFFFYNATFGTVYSYKTIADQEFPGVVFKKTKGVPLFFEIKGGVRLFRKFSIGLSYFASSRIKGNYKQYSEPWPGGNNTLIIDEQRQASFSGIQIFFGIAI